VPEIAWYGPYDLLPPPPDQTPPEPDLDGDGYSPSEGDCDDTDSSVGPNPLEFYEYCDGLDNDCGGTVDVIDDSGDNTCARDISFEQKLMVDVLFVLDTTDPMPVYQPELASGAINILESLAGEPYLDSHIGTITMEADGEAAGLLVPFDGETYISGSNVGPTAERSMVWAEAFVGATFTENLPALLPEKGRRSASLALGTGLDAEVESPNVGFLREDAHLVIVFMSSTEDQTIEPTIEAFEAELALLKGSLSEVTIHAVVQSGELDCYGSSKPAQKGYTYQKLAQDTAGTVLSICQDVTSGFFEAMGQNSAYEGLETEFPLLLQAQADSVVVTVIDTLGNSRELTDFALGDDNRTLVITADPPPSAGSTIVVDFEMDPDSD
jgi:hypothetical protein